MNISKVSNYSIMCMHGGLVVYIKLGTSFKEIEVKAKFPFEVEYCCVEVSVSYSKPFLIFITYCPPHVSKLAYLNSFENFLSEFQMFQGRIVIMGDLNIDLLKADAHCIKLFNICKLFGYWQLLNNPTRISDSSFTLIDHIFVNRKEDFPLFGSISLCSSDHNLIYCAHRSKKQVFPPRTIISRNLKSVDEEKFSHDLKSLDWGLLTSTDVSSDDLYTKYSNNVLLALNRHSKIVKRKVKGKNSPWLNNHVLKLCKSRDLLKKRFCRTQDKNIWNDYKSARNIANYELRKAKKCYFLKTFSNVRGSTELWSVANLLLNYKHTESTRISCLMVDGELTEDDSKITESLSNEFILDSTNLNDPSIEDRIEEYDSKFSLNFPELRDPPEIDVTELTEAVKGIKKSSHDLNEPSLQFIKRVPILLTYLTLIFTAFFKSFDIPNCLKTAKITPLYKHKGKKNAPSSYRPISTVPLVAKIFEKVFYNRLLTVVEKQLSVKQHGFRKHRSCETALSIFTQSIFQMIDGRKKKAVAVFIDFSKAFDSVNKDLLILKLMKNFSLPPLYIRILNNYLSNRTVTIKNGPNFISQKKPLLSALPQGSILSPLLFSLFINDIGESLSGSDFLLYADDLTFFLSEPTLAQSIAKAENVLLSLSKWCSKNGLKINFNKSEFMIFSKEHDRTIEPHKTELVCEGNIIKKTNKFKYLGIIIDEHLTFRSHFSHVINKCSSAAAKIESLKRFLCPKTFKIFVSAFVISISDYCLTVWGTFSETDARSIQIIIDRLLYRFFSHKNDRSHFTQSSNVLLSRSYFGFLNIQQRTQYFLIKIIAKLVYSFECPPEYTDWFMFSQNQRNSRTLPLLQVPRSASSAFFRSFRWRGVKAWNSLPKTWDIKTLPFTKFISLVKLHLLSEENSIYTSN